MYTYVYIHTSVYYYKQGFIRGLVFGKAFMFYPETNHVCIYTYIYIHIYIYIYIYTR